MTDPGTPPTFVWRAHPLGILALALSGSNTASGLLLLIPFLRWGGRVAKELSLAAPTEWLRPFHLSTDLPPLLNAAANLLWLSWAAAVAATWLRHFRFIARRYTDWLCLRGGWWTRRERWLRLNAVGAVCARRTLLMSLLGLCTVTAVTTGYPCADDARPVVFPAIRAAHLPSLVAALLHEPLASVAGSSACLSAPACRLRPRLTALPRYVLCPLAAAAAALWWTAEADTFRAAAVTALVFSVWWLAIRAAGFRRAGLTVTDAGEWILRAPRRLSLWEVRLHPSAITEIRLRRGVFRFLFRGCALGITLAGGEGVRGNRARLRVWSLPYTEARAWLERYLL